MCVCVPESESLSLSLRSLCPGQLPLFSEPCRAQFISANRLAIAVAHSTTQQSTVLGLSSFFFINHCSSSYYSTTQSERARCHLTEQEREERNGGDDDALTQQQVCGDAICKQVHKKNIFPRLVARTVQAGRRLTNTAVT